MSDNLPHSRLLGDLPFDVLLRIFDECDVVGILNLSATCRGVNEASGEHQTWANQVRRLKIPVPADTFPPRAELKEWAVSWSRSDERWVKPRTHDDDRPLCLHWFDMHHENYEDALVMANLIPGGKFVVTLYIDGQINLKEIKTGSEDGWDLRDVAQYKQDNPGDTHVAFWSQLLTETNLGRPLVAYVGQEQKDLLVFLVDHVAGIIQWKQTVRLDNISFHKIHAIHARGNTILCFCEHSHGWCITVSELRSDPAPTHFTLSSNETPDPRGVQFFMISENAVVVCDAEGIHLYHIPELSTAEGLSTLSPVWEWLGKSSWDSGSVCTTTSRHPMLYLQRQSEIHTVAFHMDASGRDPVVSGHHISEELPAPLLSLANGDKCSFATKGRKYLCYGRRTSDVFWFDTHLLGREELVGGFSADLSHPDEDDLELQDCVVKFADFDGDTTRILIVVHGYSLWDEPVGIYICLADLPP